MILIFETFLLKYIYHICWNHLAYWFFMLHPHFFIYYWSENKNYFRAFLQGKNFFFFFPNYVTTNNSWILLFFGSGEDKIDEIGTFTF